MTATGHALIGTLIAAKISNPALAVPIALLSHFAGDVLPHWDVGTNRHTKSQKRLIIDGVADVVLGFTLSLILLSFLPPTSLFYVFGIILVSQLPDWLMTPYYFFRNKFPLFFWAYRFQKNFNHDLAYPWGLYTQVGAVIVLYLFLFKIL